MARSVDGDSPSVADSRVMDNDLLDHYRDSCLGLVNDTVYWSC